MKKVIDYIIEQYYDQVNKCLYYCDTDIYLKEEGKELINTILNEVLTKENELDFTETVIESHSCVLGVCVSYKILKDNTNLEILDKVHIVNLLYCSYNSDLIFNALKDSYNLINLLTVILPKLQGKFDEFIEKIIYKYIKSEGKYIQ